MDASSQRRGVVDRIVAAYWDFAGATRALRDERPSEATLLSFIVIAALFAFFGDLAAQVIRSEGAPLSDNPRVVTETLVGRMLVFPLGVYLLASVTTPIVARFGGEGSWYDTRLAFAWAAAVSIPSSLLVQISGAAASLTGAPWAPFAAAAPFAALTAYIWASCMAGAHGFSSPIRVLSVALAIVLGLFGAGVLLVRALSVG